MSFASKKISREAVIQAGEIWPVMPAGQRNGPGRTAAARKRSRMTGADGAGNPLRPLRRILPRTGPAGPDGKQLLPIRCGSGGFRRSGCPTVCISGTFRMEKQSLKLSLKLLSAGLTRILCSCGTDPVIVQ